LEKLAEFSKRYPQGHRFWRLVQYLRTNPSLLRTLERVKKGESLPPQEFVELGLVKDGELSELGLEILKYFDKRAKQVEEAIRRLRTRERASEDLMELGLSVNEMELKSGKFRRIVSKEVEYLLDKLGIPHKKTDSYFWIRIGNDIYTSPRKVDKTIPGPVNPEVIIEIKEYWGEKAGGSKMTNAIYETLAVASVLKKARRCGYSARYVIILDGKKQWQSRKSDLGRFLDLLNSGVIDELLCGEEISEGIRKLACSIKSSRCHPLGRDTSDLRYRT